VETRYFDILTPTSSSTVSGLMGLGSVNGLRNFENRNSQFQEKLNQTTPKRQFSNPQISSNWKAIDLKRKKCLSQGAQGYKNQNSDMGIYPQRGEPQMRPTPKIKETIFPVVPFKFYSSFQNR